MKNGFLAAQTWKLQTVKSERWKTDFHFGLVANFDFSNQSYQSYSCLYIVIKIYIKLVGLLLSNLN